MTNYTLTVIDTAGIQTYLFNTNNLRQNAGASHLVDLATRHWVQEALPKPHNVDNLEDWLEPILEDQIIEKGELAAELIYAGGGNAVILFASREKAVEFAQRLTKRVLLEAPGLQLVIAHKHGFEWNTCSLGGADGWIDQVMKDLDKEKKSQTRTQPSLSLGVTATCAFTDLPAVDYDLDNHLLSAEAMAKERYEADARLRLRDLIHVREYELPFDFDHLGGSHDESRYVAVVHADGNGMGKRVMKIRDANPGPEKNRAYIQQMRAFSLSAHREAIFALQETVAFLQSAIRTKERKGKLIYHIQDRLELKLNGKQPLLPFRPLISGGDDLTFVCDGRLGLPLAAFYLHNLSNRFLADGEKVNCRAGVAVVHTHYPFARAYELAEDLCKTAKKAVKLKEGGVATALDWHFAVSGPIRSLDEIRKREYTSDLALGAPDRAGDLLMRPIYLRDSEGNRDAALQGEWRTWHNLRTAITTFQQDVEWVDRRNKVVSLRQALRQGSDAVSLFLLGYQLKPLPALLHIDQHVRQTGWLADRNGLRCGYFDAVEAMDFFIDLEQQKG